MVKKDSANPFDHMSFKMARNIVFGVFLLFFVVVALLGYEQGFYNGLKEFCKDGTLYINEFDNYDCLVINESFNDINNNFYIETKQHDNGLEAIK